MNLLDITKNVQSWQHRCSAFLFGRYRLVAVFVLNRNTKKFITYYDLIYLSGMKINLNSQTDIQNKSEKDSMEPLTLTDFSRSPKEIYCACSHPLTDNLATQNSNPASAETTDIPCETDAPECAHYFGYVASGDRIPKECLTCPKLLKCLTNKNYIKET
jgi:hypothetical protein